MNRSATPNPEEDICTNVKSECGMQGIKFNDFQPQPVQVCHYECMEIPRQANGIKLNQVYNF